MKSSFHLVFAASLAAHVTVFAEPVCPPSLLPNGCFEEIGDNFQPANWEFPAPADVDAVSLAVRPSPSGDFVLRFAGDPLPGDAVPAVLARAPLAHLWNPAEEELRVEFLHKHDPGGSGLLPLRFGVEITSGDATTGDGAIHVVYFDNPGGYAVPEAGEWNVSEAWPLIHSPQLFTGPVEVVGFRIERIAAEVPSGSAFYLDGVRLTSEPIDFPAFSPGPAVAGAPFLMYLPMYIEWTPDLEFFLGDVPAAGAQPHEWGIEIKFEPHGILPGIHRIRAGSGEDSLSGPRLRISSPVRVTEVAPVAGSTESPTLLRMTGEGFIHGMMGAIDFDLLNLRVESDTVAHATVRPRDEGGHPLYFLLPWDQPVDGEAMFLFRDPPRIDSIAPEAGSPEGGDTIVIHGANFGEGAQVRIAGQPAEIVSITPDRIEAIAPPNDPFFALVEVIGADGVSGMFVGSYRYLGRPPGDFTGDGGIGPEDLVVALRVLTGDEPPEPVGLDNDLSGDDRLGAEDALLLLRKMGRNLPADPRLNPLSPPAVVPLQGEARAGEPFAVAVSGLPDGDVERIYWGDGSHTDVFEDGFYEHVYSRSGTFEAGFLTVGGRSSVTVAPALADLLVATIELRWPQGSLVDSENPALLLLEEDEPAPATFLATIDILGPDGPWTIESATRLAFDYEANGSRLPAGEVLLAGGTNEDFPMEVELPFPSNSAPAPGRSGVIRQMLEIQPAPRTEETFNVLPVTSANTLTVARRGGFISERDCEEAKRAWREAVARKEAKKNDCEDLALRIEELKRQRQDLEKQKEAAEEARDAAEAALAAKQAEFDQKFTVLQQFLQSQRLTLAMIGSDDPTPEGFMGVHKAGDAHVIGVIGSWGREADARRLYESINGHTMASALWALRDLKREIHTQEAEVDVMNDEIVDLEDQIEELDKEIADLEDELEDCKRECKDLDDAIEDLVSQHEECLRQIDRQRRAQGAIDEADMDGKQAGDRLPPVDRAAADAEEKVRKSAGSEADKQADLDEIDGARDCMDEVRGLISEGNNKLNGADNALADGDTEKASDLAAEARELFRQAREKLEECLGPIQRANSRATRRGVAVCPPPAFIPYPDIISTQRTYTGIASLILAPATISNPEHWERQSAEIDRMVEGMTAIFGFVNGILKLAKTPILSRMDYAEIASAAADAARNNFGGQTLFNLWVKREFHVTTTTTTRQHICVDGRFIYVRDSSSEDGPIQVESSYQKYGPILRGQDAPPLGEQLERILRSLHH